MSGANSYSEDMFRPELSPDEVVALIISKFQLAELEFTEEEGKDIIAWFTNFIKNETYMGESFYSVLTNLTPGEWIHQLNIVHRLFVLLKTQMQ